jgi:hypothetical protein
LTAFKAIARHAPGIGRWFLLLAVVAGLAPGTWLRDSRAVPIDERQLLSADRLEVPRDALGGAVEVAGAWHLRSSNFHFSGYSALLVLEDGTLLAATDHRRELRFSPPDAPRRQVRFAFFALEPEPQTHIDLEAITHDPASGRIWAAYEGSNHIERYDADLPIAQARPRAMRSWPSNQGPEAMVRLADGRFIVLAEASPRWFAPDLPGLIFPGDPVDGAEPAAFRFAPPEGFAPVDMAQLPDGRVLILLRAFQWGFPPRFTGKLVVADPDAVVPGARWPWRAVADLAAPLPMDNYEGVAVEPGADDRVVLWLISDDNRSRFQRTLLLKLLWRPNEKARGNARAPH